MNSLKKLFLTLILTIPTVFAGHSTTLANTTWHTFAYATNAPDLFFKFDATSIYYSTNNISYTLISPYSEIGNVMRLYNDLNCGTDTGKYSFILSNDTLRFTLVNDLCSSRASYFSSYYFVAMLTGIKTESSLSGIEVFPNPSADGIFNLSLTSPATGQTKISVCDVDGKIIYEKEILSGNKNYSIDLQQFPEGVYFLTVSDATGNKVIKLLR
jgi:hypothetical protein